MRNMYNTSDYNASLQFIKFKNGETIVSEVLYHKKTNKLFVLNPLEIALVDEDTSSKIYLYKWLPLSNDNVMYEIEPDAILTSGQCNSETQEMYKKYILSYEGYTEDSDTNLIN